MKARLISATVFQQRETDDTERFLCTRCDRRCATAADAAIHARSDHPETPFERRYGGTERVGAWPGGDRPERVDHDKPL